MEGRQDISLAGPDAQGTGTGSLSFPEPQGTMKDEEGISRQLGKEKTSAGLFPSTLGFWTWMHLISLSVTWEQDFPLYWAV